MNEPLPICVKLRATETGSPDFIGDTDPARHVTCYARNPDGHEAARLIEELYDTLIQLRADLAEEDPALHAQRIAVIEIEIERLTAAPEKARGHHD